MDLASGAAGWHELFRSSEGMHDRCTLSPMGVQPMDRALERADMAIQRDDRGGGMGVS